MCLEEVAQCDYCQWHRHIHFNLCKLMGQQTLDAIKHQVFPLPKPEDCPDHRVKATVSIGPLACPVKECLSTGIAYELKARTAIRNHTVAKRMRGDEQRKEARRKAFARAYFAK